jgi:hypothetical protein
MSEEEYCCKQFERAVDMFELFKKERASSDNPFYTVVMGKTNAGLNIRDAISYCCWCGKKIDNYDENGDVIEEEEEK